MGIELERNVHVCIDNGTGKNRRVLALNKCDLTDQQRKALVGAHTFTGNDYIASFLCKRKQLCWKQVCKDEEFSDLFAKLGTEINVTEAMYNDLPKYFCRLYGERRVKEVNGARSTIFWRKIKKENKVIEIFLLPPCQSSLRWHIVRSNYVVRMWRSALMPVMSPDDPQNHGWLPDLKTDWIDEPCPEDVTELLLNDDKC